MENLDSALPIMLNGMLVVVLVMSFIAGLTWAMGRVFIHLDKKEKERKKAEKALKKAEKEKKKAEEAKQAAQDGEETPAKQDSSEPDEQSTEKKAEDAAGGGQS